MDKNTPILLIKMDTNIVPKIKKKKSRKTNKKLLWR